MTEQLPFRRDRRAIEERAAAAVASLDAGVDADERQRIEQWISSDPHHAVAFAEADAAWRRSADIKSLPRRATPPMFGRRQIALGLLAASAALIATPIAWNGSYERSVTTALGERRTIVLADGSRVELNTDSIVRVAFTPARRQLWLLRGEAMFHVAHDRARPFVVATSSGSIRAVGTAFNVRVRSDHVELTVTQGIVAIADDNTGPPRTIGVTAGQGAVLRPGLARPVRLDTAVVEQRLAWRDGVIELDGSTIDQAVEEFNRYRRAPIVVGDPRIATMRVGGRFAVGESDQFLHALGRSLPVRIIDGDDGSVLLVSTS